jgi:predicted aspartyl protease
MASTAGRVNEAPEPVVAVRLVGGPAGEMEVECVVDTGFTGALVLPRAVVEQLGLPVITHEEFRMVGGALGQRRHRAGSDPLARRGAQG